MNEIQCMCHNSIAVHDVYLKKEKLCVGCTHFTLHIVLNEINQFRLLLLHWLRIKVQILEFVITFVCSFIHSIGVCRMQWFLARLRSSFHSSLLCTFSRHPSPPTILPSSLTSSCHLFLGLPLNLVVPKFIYNILLGILFSSVLMYMPKPT